MLTISFSCQMNIVLSESCNGYVNTLVWTNAESITQQLMNSVKNNTCILITNDINVK